MQFSHTQIALHQATIQIEKNIISNTSWPLKPPILLGRLRFLWEKLHQVQTQNMTFLVTL